MDISFFLSMFESFADVFVWVDLQHDRHYSNIHYDEMFISRLVGLLLHFVFIC